MHNVDRERGRIDPQGEIARRELIAIPHGGARRRAKVAEGSPTVNAKEEADSPIAAFRAANRVILKDGATPGDLQDRDLPTGANRICARVEHARKGDASEEEEMRGESGASVHRCAKIVSSRVMRDVILPGAMIHGEISATVPATSSVGANPVRTAAARHATTTTIPKGEKRGISRVIDRGCPAPRLPGP
jgi:hypothetical protein